MFTTTSACGFIIIVGKIWSAVGSNVKCAGVRSEYHSSEEPCVPLSLGRTSKSGIEMVCKFTDREATGILDSHI
jgi:hypothetical protein